jgi:hypothetical protein
MVASKYILGTGMIIIAVVAFVVGLYTSPILMPPAKAADTV